MEVDLRKEYQPYRKEGEEDGLPLSQTSAEPFPLFLEWYQEAVDSSRLSLRNDQGKAVEVQLYEPYAMVLSTISPDLRPRSRVVLMREFTSAGLVFYTNYHSSKGREMEDRPQAAANFFWPALDRQVRIEGKIEKTSAEHSRRYFDSRPPKSRIGAAVSRQSEVLQNREDLVQEAGKYHEPPPCPEHWGGYLLKPDYFEFWLGRRNRLHERLAYRLQSSSNKAGHHGGEDHSPDSLDSNRGDWEKFLLYP